MNLSTYDKLRIIVAGVTGDISDAQWAEIEQGLIDQNLHVTEVGPISFKDAANEAYKIMGMTPVEPSEWDPRNMRRQVVSTDPKDPMDSATLGLIGDALLKARAE